MNLPRNIKEYFKTPVTLHLLYSKSRNQVSKPFEECPVKGNHVYYRS